MPDSARGVPGKSKHVRLDLQGLRGVAVLIGLVFHAGLYIPGGYIAFDIFFVVSGFVIGSTLLREAAFKGRVDLRRFYWRRFRRLIPPLALVVTLTVAASTLILAPGQLQHVVLPSAAGAMLLYANHAVPRASGDYFGEAAEYNPFLHTWSLSLEEQVYLVFPALLLAGLALRRKTHRGRWIGLAPLLAVGLVSFWFATQSSRGEAVLGLPASLGGYHGPVSRFWEFAAGASLAALVPLLPVVKQRLMPLLALLSWSCVAALLAAAAALHPSTPYPSAMTLWPVLAVAGLICCGAMSAGATRDLSAKPLLSHRWIAFIGDMSYSWYLWHWPCISLARSLGATQTQIVIVAVASAAPAYLSYRYLEVPAMRERQRVFSWRYSTSVVAAPLALLLAASVVLTTGYLPDDVRRFTAADQKHLGHAANCFGKPAADACRWGTEQAHAGELVLFGDSNAEQWVEGAIAAAQRYGQSTRGVLKDSCPPLDLQVELRSAPSRYEDPATRTQVCRRWYDDAMRWLSHRAPSTVAIAFSSDYTRGVEGALTRGGVRPATLEDRVATARQGLVSTVRRLQEARHRVVLVQVIPDQLHGLDWGPRECSALQMMSGTCVAATDVARLSDNFKAVRAMIARVGLEHRLPVVDPVPLLCAGGTCTTERDGTVLYRDEVHVSVAASRLAADAFAQALRP